MEFFSKFNKRMAFSKAVGPRKISKINKSRTYVYSGVESNFSFGHIPLKVYYFLHFHQNQLRYFLIWSLQVTLGAHMTQVH